MATYFLQRILVMIPTLILISIVIFTIPKLAPGDPAEIISGRTNMENTTRNKEVTEATLKQIRIRFNLDKPLFYCSLAPPKWNGLKNQYHIWLTNTLKGDLGISFQDSKPVFDKFVETIPITLLLDFLSIVLAYLIAIPIGIYSATHQYSVFDKISTFTLFILYSLPSFWIATMAIIFLGGGDFLDIFPPGGLKSTFIPSDWTSWDIFSDKVHHLFLPVAMYTYGSLAFLSRQMRGGMLEVIRQDYIRTARAKGLSENIVVYKHALRNSLIPIVTLLGGLLPGLIGGSVIIEQIFSIDGVGKLTFLALTARDFPVIMASLTVSALLTLLGILVSDLLYSVVDPRIAFSKKG
ncbi:ABC transporter permease [bacterium]|nr:ABC transporter permease [bacterium]